MVSFIVFNATFNNLSVNFIGGGNRKTRKKTPAFNKSLTNFRHIVVSSTPRHERTMLLVIGTDRTGSCKSNYHTITTSMAPIIT